MTLQGKTVLITGSSDGLGKAVALLAAKAGATVLVHGRSQEKSELVAGAGDEHGLALQGHSDASRADT